MKMKKSYMDELEKKLKKLPATEKLDALGYYREYLIELNIDTYDEAVARIGTPTKVAAQILADYYMKDVDEAPTTKGKGKHIIPAIILGVFALPIAIPLVVCALLLVFLLLLSLMLIILSFALVALAGIFSGLFLIGISIPTFTLHVMTALFCIGVGIAAICLGLLFAQLTIWSAKKTYLLLVWLIKKLQTKREVKKYA